MKKREFLKASTSMVMAAVLAKACKPKTRELRTNWAKNLTYSAEEVFQPATEQELLEIIKKINKGRALGTKHCFNTIAETPNVQISTENFNKVVSLDKEKATITVGAGMKYGDFCKYVEESGFALFNLASLPHISVGGACATATHGSGLKNQCLAGSVQAIKMVNGMGQVVKLEKGIDADFDGAVVALGSLGLVTEITLNLQPNFKMKQMVYQNMPMSVLEDNFKAIMDASYSVSLFTDYKNKNINEVWLKAKADFAFPEEFYGAKKQLKNLHPIETLDDVNCTEQMGVEGPWYERMPHFRMGFTPSSGVELQSEFFVPLSNAYSALMAIQAMQEKIAPHLMITEVRAIAADDFWMSPFYKKPCIAIHFTWEQHIPEVTALLPEIEAALEPFDYRPHWGKLFTMAPSKLQNSIGKLTDFKALMNKHDPKGIFRNAFVDHNLFAKN